MLLVILQKMLLVQLHLQIVIKGDTTYRLQSNPASKRNSSTCYTALSYNGKENNKEVTTDLVTDRANQKLLGSNALSCLCNCHCFY